MEGRARCTHSLTPLLWEAVHPIIAKVHMSGGHTGDELAVPHWEEVQWYCMG